MSKIFKMSRSRRENLLNFLYSAQRGQYLTTRLNPSFQSLHSGIGGVVQRRAWYKMILIWSAIFSLSEKNIVIIIIIYLKHLNKCDGVVYNTNNKL